MSEPLITIAIPTYNRADKYLRQTIECAIRQTYENIEILISDNNSTDGTPDVVRSFSDPRIKYFRQESNLGGFGNWNFLLNQARGDYFHLYHDDDKIDADFIETCMKGAEYRKDLAIIMTGSRGIDEDDNILRENPNMVQGFSIEDFILAWFQSRINIYLCSTLFGTKVLRNVGGFEKKYNHYDDIAAHLKCTAAGERVDISDVKAGFRHHDGSITSNSSSVKIDSWIRDSKLLLNLTLSLSTKKHKEIKRFGRHRSAMNMYMYASEISSRRDRFKAFLNIYKEFGFKYIPPAKYLNKLVPFLGYLLHPYYAIRKLKWLVVNRSKHHMA